VTQPPATYDDLTAVFINCTLKRSPELTHTGGLIDISRSIMEKHGVGVDVIRAVDHDIATGVWPDMTEHGWASDEWPALYERIQRADLLVIAGPIWLGDNSSVTKRVIERLYACSSLSTTPASTRTTAGSAAASSPATRTVSSTAR
jgi:multimeric flavodoxin WrbA